MTLDEKINEAKITVVLCEKEARKCIQHGGSFYEEKANKFRESAKEYEQVIEWLEELKSYRELRYMGCHGCVHYDQQQTALICRDCKRYYRDMYEDGEEK